MHSSLVDQLYTKEALTVSIGRLHTWRVSRDFYKRPSSRPATLNTLTALPYISLKELFLLWPPYFFFIRTFQSPSKRYTRFRWVLKGLLTRYFSASNKIPFLEIAWFFPHTGTPLNVHPVSKPWSPSLSNHNGE